MVGVATESSNVYHFGDLDLDLKSFPPLMWQVDEINFSDRGAAVLVMTQPQPVRVKLFGADGIEINFTLQMASESVAEAEAALESFAVKYSEDRDVQHKLQQILLQVFNSDLMQSGDPSLELLWANFLGVTTSGSREIEVSVVEGQIVLRAVSHVDVVNSRVGSRDVIMEANPGEHLAAQIMEFVIKPEGVGAAGGRFVVEPVISEMRVSDSRFSRYVFVPPTPGQLLSRAIQMRQVNVRFLDALSGFAMRYYGDCNFANLQERASMDGSFSLPESARALIKALQRPNGKDSAQLAGWREDMLRLIAAGNHQRTTGVLGFGAVQSSIRGDDALTILMCCNQSDGEIYDALLAKEDGMQVDFSPRSISHLSSRQFLHIAGRILDEDRKSRFASGRGERRPRCPLTEVMTESKDVERAIFGGALRCLRFLVAPRNRSENVAKLKTDRDRALAQDLVILQRMLADEVSCTGLLQAGLSDVDMQQFAGFCRAFFPNSDYVAPMVRAWGDPSFRHVQKDAWKAQMEEAFAMSDSDAAVSNVYNRGPFADERMRAGFFEPREVVGDSARALGVLGGEGGIEHHVLSDEEHRRLLGDGLPVPQTPASRVGGLRSGHEVGEESAAGELEGGRRSSVTVGGGQG